VPESTFVIEALGRTVSFGADTIHIPQLDEVARRFPAPDFALLPISGLQIRPAFRRPESLYAFLGGLPTYPLQFRPLTHASGRDERRRRGRALRRVATFVAVPIHDWFRGGPF